MGRKKQGKPAGHEAKLIVMGGSFTRASYRLSPLSEDIKNSLISLFQFVIEGQRLNGRVDVGILDKTTSIPTEYGDVSITRREHPVNRKLYSDYTFTVPMQYFIKGRRTDGRFYKEIAQALDGLSMCRFVFVDSIKNMKLRTNTGIINNVQILTTKDNDIILGRESFVTFTMMRPMLQVFFDATFGFHKFIEEECISLTSIYAKRMYEILCNQKTGSIYRMELEKFKDMFCILDKYKRLKDLVKNVLELLKEEINLKTSLTIDYSLHKSASESGGTIIDFKVLRNSSGMTRSELERRCRLGPNVELEYFLRNSVGMKKTEIRPHAMLLDKIMKIPGYLDELAYKWERTCEKIALPDPCTKVMAEDVRKQRIAHLVATMKGMIEDSGL